MSETTDVDAALQGLHNLQLLLDAFKELVEENPSVLEDEEE